MARTLPKPVVEAIELAINIAHQQGKAPDLIKIAEIFNTTYESVGRIRRRIVRFARTGIDERKKAGPKPLKGQNEDEVAQFVRDLLAQRPELGQKAVSDCCLEKFGVRIGQSTISRLMKGRGIPHKRTCKLYPKTKLVSTHPDGIIMPVSSERVPAAEASPDYTVAPPIRSYTSPYQSLSQNAGGAPVEESSDPPTTNPYYIPNNMRRFAPYA